MQRTTGRTFVLVHGASHGSWCWARLATLLRQEGHQVHTPCLTGTGERSHLYDDNIGLECHVRDVINEILWGDLENVILCGHSYGGMVVSSVADRIRDRIDAIAYLNAFVPEDGQSVIDILGIVPPNGPVPPMSAEVMKVNDQDRAWVDGKLTPQPPRTLCDPACLTGAWATVPNKTYILASQSAAPPLKATYDRFAQQSDWTVTQVDTGHDAMIDRPDLLARILMAQ